MAESDVLSIQPDNSVVDVHHEWKTDVLSFDSGNEQRRQVRNRKLVGLTLSFKHAFANGQLDDFITFFDARKGAFDYFTLPSWVNDARTVGEYTSGLQIGLNTISRFTTDASSIGNLIVIGKRDATNPLNFIMEARRIASISGNTITLASALNTTYPNGSFAYVGYKVRFSQDQLTRKIHGGQIYISEDIDFIGVL